MKPDTLAFFEKRIKLVREKFNLSPIDAKSTIHMEGIANIMTLSQTSLGKASLGVKALFSRVHIGKMVERLASDAGITDRQSREYSSLFFLTIVLVVLGTARYEQIISGLGYSADDMSLMSFTKDDTFPRRLADYLAEEYPQFDEFKTSLESLGMQL